MCSSPFFSLTSVKEANVHVTDTYVFLFSCPPLPKRQGLESGLPILGGRPYLALRPIKPFAALST